MLEAINAAHGDPDGAGKLLSAGMPKRHARMVQGRWRFGFSPYLKNRDSPDREAAKSGQYPIPQLSFQILFRFQFALPQHNHLPPQFPQPILILPVSFNRSSKFGQPMLRPGGGGGGSWASRMAVPKASMDENHCGIFGQDDIGAARQIFPVQPEPETHSMKQRPNPDFRPGIPGPHPPHNFASFFGGNRIHGAESKRRHSPTKIGRTRRCFW